ncbi:MAG: DUF1989 domain-containing protein [Kiloniellales bacterium]
MPAILVPPREGRAVDLRRGQVLRLTTPKGRQAADFFAFNASDLGEWLSPPHSWVTTFSVKPRVGDVLISRFRRPMLKLVADTAGGCHDMLIAACDQKRYAFFGHQGPHASCAQNLETAMRGRGHAVPVIPQPVNFFTHTRVEPDGRLVSPPNPVPPGAYVELEALIDLVCVVSSCPFDLAIEGWEINAGREVTELQIDVRDAA